MQYPFKKIFKRFSFFFKYYNCKIIAQLKILHFSKSLINCICNFLRLLIFYTFQNRTNQMLFNKSFFSSCFSNAICHNCDKITFIKLNGTLFVLNDTLNS